MIRKLNFHYSVNSMLILLTLVLAYHVLIIIEIMPYDAVWGGRLETKSQMYAFESVSIVVNMFIMLVVLIKGVYIKIRISVRIINILLWILTAMFALNTIGNLFSDNLLEMIIFTPLTLVSAILCYRMAVEKKEIET